jgi:hypothetical protein
MSPRERNLVLRLHLAVAAAAALSLAAGAALADDDKDKDKKKDDSGDEEPPPKKKKPPEPPKPKPDDERPDHDRVVGRLGVSWFGVSTIPMGMGAPSGTADNPSLMVSAPITINAPALGIRWWFNQTLGIDVGLGFGYSGGSTTDTTGTTSTSTSKLGAFGMLIHGGVPLSLATGKHISLQITPETNLGFAHASVSPTAPMSGLPSAGLNGFRFDLGARIGGEVQFGFIGIPELSLEGSIGAFFTYQSTGVSAGPASHNDSSVGLTTASFNNPWDFFASVVRARYYF